MVKRPLASCEDRRHLHMGPAPSPRRGDLAFIQFGSNGRPPDNALFLNLLDQRQYVGSEPLCSLLSGLCADPGGILEPRVAEFLAPAP